MLASDGKIGSDARRLKSALEERQEGSHGVWSRVPRRWAGDLTIVNDENHVDF
jgi:hypothetical protein